MDKPTGEMGCSSVGPYHSYKRGGMIGPYWSYPKPSGWEVCYLRTDFTSVMLQSAAGE